MTASMTPPASDVHPSDLRRALGRVPTAVSIVTAIVDGEPVGMTIGSLTSVSTAPPLVGFFVGTQSQTFTRLRRAPSFCINVLTDAQDEICTAFASRAGEKFHRGRWNHPDDRAPHLEDATVVLHCDQHAVFDAGDHTGVLGYVTDITYTDTTPLVFYRGRMTRMHPSAAHRPTTTRLDWWSL